MSDREDGQMVENVRAYWVCDRLTCMRGYRVLIGRFMLLAESEMLRVPCGPLRKRPVVKGKRRDLTGQRVYSKTVSAALGMCRTIC